MSKNIKVTEIKEGDVKEALDDEINADAVVEESNKKEEDEKSDDEKEEKSSCKDKYKMTKEALESFKSVIADQEGIPEAFASKLATMFEAIVNETTSNAIEEIEAKSHNDMLDNVAKVFEEMATKTDSYLDLKMQEWVKENEQAIASNHTVEKATKVLESLKTLASENGLELSEDENNAIKESQAKAEELEAKLNEQTEQLMAVKKQLDEANQSKIFDELSKELTEAEKGRLSKLIENVTVADSEDYKTKVLELKESVFSDKAEPILENDTVDVVKENEGRPLSLMETLDVMYTKKKD